MPKYGSGWLRDYNEEIRARRERDRPFRAARLASGAVAEWTGVIKQAAAIVRVGKRPCDYGPWMQVLKELGRDPPFLGTLQPDRKPYETLMRAAWDVAQPGWVEPRRDLIEFSLAFLEADVMLHGSGYAKRHLLKRLQQSDLTDQDVARLRVLFMRAVQDGTGLEEARAYRKIAAHLVLEQRLPGFAAWLEDAAKGAILTMDRATGMMWQEIVLNPNLSEADKDRLMRVNWLGPSKWGIVYPDMMQVTRAGALLKEPDQKICRTAHSMLQAIRVRQASEPRSG